MEKRSMPRGRLSIGLFVLWLSACADGDATIQDIMRAEVNPAASAIWGAVALESTAQGTREFSPREDAEWEALKRHANALIASAGRLEIPRKVAPTGATLADANFPGNLKAPDIQTGIDSDFEGFIGRAWTLRDAGKFTLDAIEKRSTEQLAEAGELVNDACSACHDAYWFPNSIQPVQ
jgi:hypothetical protein